MCRAFFTSSVNADITLPSANNDLFIMIPSFRVEPVAPVFFARSDPARSTKWNFATVNSEVLTSLSVDVSI